MRKLTTALLAAAGIFVFGSALADLTVKDGGGVTRTIKNFVCETTKLCNATVLIASDGTEISPATSAQAGSLTETAPATDTASSGLNGRLQRIAQRLTSMIALLPTSLGAGGGLKVDGSGTALPVSVSGVATAANQTTELSSLGATNESAAGTDTATSGLNGLIKRLLQSITTLNGKIDTLNTNVTAAIPAGTNEIGGVNVTKIAGTAASVNSGNKDAGTQRIVLATDQPALTNPQPATIPLKTTGGWTPKRLSALSTTVTAIKSSAAGSLGMLVCGNPNASIIFIQVFDVATAGAVTLGTTVPDLSFQVDASSSIGFALPVNGMAFANGMQVAATTTATGSSAPGTAANCNAGFN